LFILRNLQLVEQGIEVLEAAFPKLAVSLQQFGCLRKRFGLESPRTALRVPAARNQACTLKYSKVLGDRGLAHCERFSQFKHGRLTCGEPRQDRASRGIGKGCERCVKTLRRFITSKFYNHLVIIRGLAKTVKAQGFIVPPANCSVAGCLFAWLPINGEY